MRCSLRLVNHKLDDLEVLSIPSIDSFRRYWRIIGSCNGLLCVQVSDDGGMPPCSLWLWNPVIREVREVPNTLNDYKRSCGLGFGFSSAVNDYKIVRFYNQEFCKKKKDQFYELVKHDGVQMFSLSAGSWKELEFEALDDRIVPIHGFNADGKFFWLGYRPPFFSHILISFDIAAEVFPVTPIPIEHVITPIGFGVYENKFEYHRLIEEGPGSYFICVCLLEEVASGSGNSLTCTQKYRIGPISDALLPKCFWMNEVACRDLKDIEGDPKCVLHMVNLITNERRKFSCSINTHSCDTFTYQNHLFTVGFYGDMHIFSEQQDVAADPTIWVQLHELNGADYLLLTTKFLNKLLTKMSQSIISSSIYFSVKKKIYIFLTSK